MFLGVKLGIPNLGTDDPSSRSLTEGLVSWWKLDETAGGRYQANVDITHGYKGIGTHANGTTVLGSTPGTTKATINVWTFFYTNSNGTFKSVFVKSGTVYASGTYAFGIDAPADGIGAPHRIRAHFDGTATNYAEIPSAVQFRVTPHMVTIVFDGDGVTDADKIKIYIDGVENTPLTIGGVIPSALSATPQSLVQYTTATNRGVGYWDRALNSTEVTTLYNSGIPMAYSQVVASSLTTNLVYYMDGTPATLESFNHNPNYPEATEWMGKDQISGNLPTTVSPATLYGASVPTSGYLTLTDNNTVLKGGGVGSYALALDGASQYLSIADPFAPPTAFTISVWVYPTTVAAGTHAIAQHGRTALNTGAWILYLNANVPTMLFSPDGTLGSSVSATSGAVAVNGWYLITARWDGANITCYTNTTAGVPAAFAGPVYNSTEDMTVGSNVTPSNFFGGRFQNLVIWNSTDKGESIVTDLYNSGRGLRYEQLTAAQKTGLFDFWPLGEASGNRVGSYAATALAPTNAPGRLAGIVNSSKTSTGANFVAANNEYLSVVSNPGLETGDIDFAIWCWFNTNSLPTGLVTAGIVSKGTNAAREYSLFIGDFTNDANAVNFRVYAGGGSSGEGIAKTTGWAPTVGQWHFAIGWHDATSGTTYVQVDNGTVFSGADTGDPAATTGGFSIGTSWALTTVDLDGVVEETGFMKGRYPTASERTYLYNNGVARTYSGGKII